MKNKTYTETIKWRDKDNAHLEYVQSIPTYDDEVKKVTGTSKQVGTQDVTYEDLTIGLEKTELTLTNKLNQKKNIDTSIKMNKNKLKEMNMPLEITPSLRRLQKQLVALRILSEITQSKERDVKLDDEIQELRNIIKVRKQTINSRPE